MTADQSILLLTKLQYCHVIDHNTGVVRLVEGPFRGPLESNEQVYGGIEDKFIVREGQYAVVLNPWDAALSELALGDREVRVGPCVFSLVPGEQLEDDKIHDEYVLTKDTGLRVKALRGFDDAEHDVRREAGDQWVIAGPARYIPPKYAEVQEHVHALSLGATEGVYVKDLRSGHIRLERGPKELMLQAHEELHAKEYLDEELEALGLRELDLDATRAVPLRLLRSEAAMITDGEHQRVDLGPRIILLEPFERPYVMDLSGHTPKVPHVLKVWKVMLGPVFTTDELSVRTRDNASLAVRLRYKWRFQVDEAHLERIFAVEDFIGFATETLAGLIREEAARHDFESFHSEAATTITRRVFGDDDSYVFAENGFEIFGIDIKNIHPEDPEIAAQLNSAIKSNMEVYVQKIQQTARIEAERELVRGRIEIEQARAQLIEIEQANQRTEQLGAAQIEAEAAVARARGEAEALELRRAAEARAEAERVTRITASLQTDGAERYLRLRQIDGFGKVDKTLVVPTDARIYLPMGDASVPVED